MISLYHEDSSPKYVIKTLLKYTNTSAFNPVDIKSTCGWWNKNTEMPVDCTLTRALLWSSRLVIWNVCLWCGSIPLISLVHDWVCFTSDEHNRSPYLNTLDLFMQGLYHSYIPIHKKFYSLWCISFISKFISIA